LFKGRVKATGEEVSVKVLSPKSDAAGQKEIVEQRENFKRLRSLFGSHPGIARLIGFVERRSSEGVTPVEITQWMGNGSLQDMIENDGRGMAPANWTDTKKAACVFGVAATMKFIHSVNVIHRNLRPSNILFDGEFLAHVGGFDFAVVAKGKVNELGVGTPLHMAPELFYKESGGEYDNKVDVYAFAVTLYRMFSDCMELDNGQPISSSGAVAASVMQGARFKRVPGIPGFYWSLIESCWNQDPRKRPSFSEILDVLRSDRSYYAFPDTDLEALEALEDKILAAGAGQKGRGAR
jgi:serine/threonine protein kinase